MSTETIAEFAFSEVKAHNSKKDLWVVIDGKVYDVSRFVDEHPGGEEVLLDVAGQDATEAFDDVGHSDEAREILAGLVKGKLKGGVDKPTGKPATSTTTTTSSGESQIAVYIAIIAGIVLAFGAYKYLQVAA